MILKIKFRKAQNKYYFNQSNRVTCLKKTNLHENYQNFIDDYQSGT